jgi:hypothetical protein
VFVLQPTPLWVLWHGSASISPLSRMKPTGSSALQRRLAADPTLFTIVASLAAFGAYTAMYAFRKPFSAATFSGQEIGGVSLKVLLVVAQLVGYTLSKFLGIKVVSEAGAGRRIALIAGLIGLAFLPLVLLPQVPPWAQVVCLFINGLPLGMIWGLIFGFLEGRRVTEFLGLGMSVSFIFASGWTKSVGVYLMTRWAVPELWMPSIAGLVFLPLLVICLVLLAALPAPSPQDVAERSERVPMNGPQRRQFLARNAVSLALLILPYVLLTVVVVDSGSLEGSGHLSRAHQPGGDSGGWRHAGIPKGLVGSGRLDGAHRVGRLSGLCALQQRALRSPSGRDATGWNRCLPHPSGRFRGLPGIGLALPSEDVHQGFARVDPVDPERRIGPGRSGSCASGGLVDLTEIVPACNSIGSKRSVTSRCRTAPKFCWRGSINYGQLTLCSRIGYETVTR